MSTHLSFHRSYTTYLAAALLLSSVCFNVAGCVVDTDVPTDALLTCARAADCPDGWTCNEKTDRCQPPGSGDATDGDADPAGDMSDEQSDESSEETPEIIVDGEESADWRDEHRAEEKAADCAAIWDKAQLCPEAVAAILGEGVAAALGGSKDAFVYDLCVMTLLHHASEDDIDELTSSVSLIPLASCSLFATSLCDLFPPQSGFVTIDCP